jgi:hypothetical protein
MFSVLRACATGYYDRDSHFTLDDSQKYSALEKVLLLQVADDPDHNMLHIYMEAIANAFVPPLEVGFVLCPLNPF